MAGTSGIKFLYQFSVGEYDYINPGVNVVSVTSTALGDHDKKNLTTAALRETWRSDGVASPQEIVIQANDTTVTPDVFAILNHNFSEDAVVVLQAAFSTDFSSPAITIPFIWNEKHMLISQDLGLAYPYYKIKIIDSTNGCGFIEIGRIVAGKSFTFMNDEDISDDFQVGTDDLASSSKTEGFLRASNERVMIDTLTVKFPRLNSKSGSDTNYKALVKMTRFVRTTLPFLTIVDPNEPYFTLLWGQLRSIPSRSLTIERFADFPLTVEEVF